MLEKSTTEDSGAKPSPSNLVDEADPDPDPYEDRAASFGAEALGMKSYMSLRDQYYDK